MLTRLNAGCDLACACLTLKEPGSQSSGLLQQFRDLQWDIQEDRVKVHEQAWAVIHTGGNDLYFTNPRKVLAFAAVSNTLDKYYFPRVQPSHPFLTYISYVRVG